MQFVSIVIPTVGRIKTLQDAVRSATKQTYKDSEVVVVLDDPDRYIDVKSICDTYGVSMVINYGARGPSGARNCGVEYSRGQYIAFLDDDDIWHPEKTAKQVEVFESGPKDLGFVHCWAEYFNSSGTTGVVQKHVTNSTYKPVDFINATRCNGTQTVMIRRDAFEHLGGFDENIRYWEDQELYARLAVYYKHEVLPEVLVRIRVDHEYERLTDGEEGKIYESAQAMKYIYKKHQEWFVNDEESKRRMYLRIAGEYQRARALHQCLKYYYKAAFIGTPYPRIIFYSIRAIFRIVILRR